MIQFLRMQSCVNYHAVIKLRVCVGITIYNN